MRKQQGLVKVPEIGATVRHTGTFLRSTGQMTGSAGLDKWKVIGTMRNGKAMKAGDAITKDDTCVYIIVNEKAVYWNQDPLTEEDLASMTEFERETIKWKRINAWNLEEVGKPPRAANYP